jgi:signal peptidase II
MKRSHIVVLLVLLVLLIDQALKFYIKLNFEYNQDVPMLGLDWARLHFVENEGMAFGITFDVTWGKLALSSFRILMVGGLIWYIRLLLKANASLGLLSSVALITAGALGNIIDSAVYGLIFTESPYHGGLAQFASAENPAYGSFLHGKVVDMLYFPMHYFHVPEWVPKFGGEEWLFFSPIFNIADAAITCGVLSILLFQRRFFKDVHPAEAAASVAAAETTVESNEAAGMEELSTEDVDNQVVDSADSSAETLPGGEPAPAETPAPDEQQRD